MDSAAVSEDIAPIGLVGESCGTFMNMTDWAFLDWAKPDLPSIVPAEA